LRADRINREALEAGDLHIGDLEPDDVVRLESLLKDHQRETGSKLASALLANFDTEVSQFSRVLPADYAAVVKIRQDALTAGIDPDSDEIWKQILEVTNG
jgi:glutamate synthase (NADPH/NADH) large chain